MNPLHTSERGAYLGAIAAMTEMDRTSTDVEVRGALGIGGEKEDAR